MRGAAAGRGGLSAGAGDALPGLIRLHLDWRAFVAEPLHLIKGRNVSFFALKLFGGFFVGCCFLVFGFWLFFFFAFSLKWQMCKKNQRSKKTWEKKWHKELQ